MISIILTIIAFILIASLYVSQPLTLNLRAYISTIIIGFIITIYHLIHLTIPYDLTSLMLIASLFILIKHRHLFNFKRGRLFLKHMFIYLYRIILFLSACIYISTVESQLLMDWPYGSPPSLIVLHSLLFVIFLGHQLMVVIYVLKM